MAKRSYGQKRESHVDAMREHKRAELERRLERVRQRRASYQRKVIGTAVAFFIVIIILCALLPSDNAWSSDDGGAHAVNSRQAKIFQSLRDNFK